MIVEPLYKINCWELAKLKTIFPIQTKKDFLCLTTGRRFLHLVNLLLVLVLSQPEITEHVENVNYCGIININIIFLVYPALQTCF